VRSKIAQKRVVAEFEPARVRSDELKAHLEKSGFIAVEA